MNGGKCVIVNGVCEISCDYSENCEYNYCMKNGNTCEYDSCSAYTTNECKGLNENCIYSNNHCKIGNCEILIDLEECNNNERCEIIFDLNDGKQTCKTNECGNSMNCDNEDCIHVKGNCLFDKCKSYSGNECVNHDSCVLNSNNACVYDMCSSYDKDECNNHKECVYDNVKLCHKEICSSFGSDINKCNMNEGKCVIVNGVCVNGCEYSEECLYDYCYEISGNCKYDECSSYTQSTCERINSGCIYTNNHCESGECENIILEEDCGRNKRCKLIFDIEDSKRKCWTNDCNNNNCESKYCIRKDEMCVFDICQSLNRNECNNNDKCIYDNSHGCHEGKCFDLESDINNCNMNEGKCVIVNGLCKNDCRFSDNCEFNYCEINGGTCKIRECVEHTVNNCYIEERCVWDVSSEMCSVGSCSNFLTLSDCETQTNGDKCAYISGACINNNCNLYNGNENNCETNKLCIWEDPKCVVSKCARYTNEECVSGQVGCVYRDGYCVSGVCGLLDTGNDECISNKKCKKLISIDNEKPVCWENNCSEFNTNECPTVGCVIGLNDEIEMCLFDECNIYTNLECNEKAECVYTFNEGCHKGICRDIETDSESCRMNSKCRVVKGTCEFGCFESNCNSEMYCLEEEGICKYDSCSEWKADECYKKEGCIWDNSFILNGISGLCKTGNCGSLSSENGCNNVENHNMCGYVTGRCSSNPCKYSDCEDVLTVGCKESDEGLCIVDECMKYDERSCVMDGCVIISYNDENRCVSGVCSSVESGSDCRINDPRCKIVKGTCVENPCNNKDCNSPSCMKNSEQCIYDECSQFIPSGLFINLFLLFIIDTFILFFVYLYKYRLQ
jgi:hypothetical protein